MIFSTSCGVYGSDYRNSLPFHSLILSCLICLLYFHYLFLIKLFIHFLVIHWMKPLSIRCHMRAQWTIPVISLHALYIAILVGVTTAVHHIEFRFDELKDLWRGILVSAVSIGTPFPRFIKMLLISLFIFEVPGFLVTSSLRLLLR